MNFDFSKVEGFDWDAGNLEHIRKHGVEVKECEDIFANKPRIISKDKAHSTTEERYQILGRTKKNRLIFVAFTIRSNRIRPVSARGQNRKERNQIKEVIGNEKN